MRQRMELTRTNRSCGLTTYFSHRWSSRSDGRRHQRPTLDFEARREKVKVVTHTINRHPRCPLRCLLDRRWDMQASTIDEESLTRVALTELVTRPAASHFVPGFSWRLYRRGHTRSHPEHGS